MYDGTGPRVSATGTSSSATSASNTQSGSSSSGGGGGGGATNKAPLKSCPTIPEESPTEFLLQGRSKTLGRAPSSGRLVSSGGRGSFSSDTGTDISGYCEPFGKAQPPPSSYRCE